jgi:hypothetical protein
MKKLIIVLVLLLAAAALFGQAIKLGGNFPSAKYLDAPKGGEFDYEAVWEFSADNIKVTDVKTGEVFDFSKYKVNDFQTAMDGRQIVVTFSCPDAQNRSYTIKTTLPGTDLILEIERPDLPKYSVTMKQQ